MGFLDLLEQVLILPLNLHVLGLEHFILFGILLKKGSVCKVWILLELLEELGLGSRDFVDFKFVDLHFVRNFLFLKHVLEKRL
jgi:hypothetical protein